VLETRQAVPSSMLSGKPRVVINGTALDYLAESFMAGDPYQGGGFVILNGLTFDKKRTGGPSGRYPILGRISFHSHRVEQIFVPRPASEHRTGAVERRSDPSLYAKRLEADAPLSEGE